MGRIELQDPSNENRCVTVGYLNELYEEIAQSRKRIKRLTGEVEEMEDRLSTALGEVARLQRVITERRLAA